ncbi:MAG: hypothetical protein WBA67_07575 [Jannaschia sp.]
MSFADFKSDWTPFRDALLSRYPSLSDADLMDADGDIDILAARLSKGQGRTRADASQDLYAFLAGPMPADAFAAPQHDGAALADSGRYVPEGEDVLADDRRFGDDTLEDSPTGRRTR